MTATTNNDNDENDDDDESNMTQLPPCFFYAIQRPDRVYNSALLRRETANEYNSTRDASIN